MLPHSNLSAHLSHQTRNFLNKESFSNTDFFDDFFVDVQRPSLTLPVVFEGSSQDWSTTTWPASPATGVKTNYVPPVAATPLEKYWNMVTDNYYFWGCKGIDLLHPYYYVFDMDGYVLDPMPYQIVLLFHPCLAKKCLSGNKYYLIRFDLIYR